MVLPDNVPLNATTPAAPKLTRSPLSEPLTSIVPIGGDMVTVPLSAFPVCVHVTVMWPLEGPVVVSPSHVPLKLRVGGMVARGDGGARPIAPVTTSAARPTSSATTASVRSVLFRLTSRDYRRRLALCPRLRANLPTNISQYPRSTVDS
jgi:hypothetical protein